MMVKRMVSLKSETAHILLHHVRSSTYDRAVTTVRVHVVVRSSR